MDMGGAGVVAGVIVRAGAAPRARQCRRRRRSGREHARRPAQRPGDIVKSMKGDTIEVINTDAEGRLVLADVLWYAQDRFKPAAIVDLATLTGAIIIALGHENAGVFSNDDALADAVLKAAGTEGEGAWRLPLAPAYDKLDRSAAGRYQEYRRPAGGLDHRGAVPATLRRRGHALVHLDIAGGAAARRNRDGPEGRDRLGVMTLDRLVRDRFEAKA